MLLSRHERATRGRELRSSWPKARRTRRGQVQTPSRQEIGHWGVCLWRLEELAELLAPLRHVIVPVH